MRFAHGSRSWTVSAYGVRERAYAAALLLTLIVLVLSIVGRMITHRFSKNKIK